MPRRKSPEGKQNTDRWLLTYSDMMNNLLVLFMVLYAMSVMDMNKFKALAQHMNSAFSAAPITNSTHQGNDAPPIPMDQTLEHIDEPDQKDEFEQVYDSLMEKIKEKGYQDLLTVEKGEDYIKFRFGDNVLFYPDSPQFISDRIEVLTFIGSVLSEINPMIQTIEIGGHTATTGEATNSFFSWELSSQRAISVLKYLVQNCRLPESKMTISGYSRYHPIAGNDTEADRQLNRRVEIKITRVTGTS